MSELGLGRTSAMALVGFAAHPVEVEAHVGAGVPGFAMVGDEVGKAPRAVRLIDPNVVAARDQLAEHAAQEMSVAVIPA